MNECHTEKKGRRDKREASQHCPRSQYLRHLCVLPSALSPPLLMSPFSRHSQRAGASWESSSGVGPRICISNVSSVTPQLENGVLSKLKHSRAPAPRGEAAGEGRCLSAGAPTLPATPGDDPRLAGWDRAGGGPSLHCTPPGPSNPGRAQFLQIHLPAPTHVPGDASGTGPRRAEGGAAGRGCTSQRTGVERRSLSGGGQAGDPELGPSRVSPPRCCHDASFDVSCQQRGLPRASQSPATLSLCECGLLLPELCPARPPRPPRLGSGGRARDKRTEPRDTPAGCREGPAPGTRGHAACSLAVQGTSSRGGCTVGLSSSAAP